MDIVWAKLVRAGERTDRGTPDSRDQVFRRLAGHQLQPGSAGELYAALDPTALDGLRRDGLLRSSSVAPWQVLPEFAHELLRTFALSKMLLAAGEPVTALIEADTPRLALPAARLAAQVLLAAPETAQMPMAGRLKSIQTDFDRLAEAGHGQRWSDLPTEAVVPLPQVETVLGDAWVELLEKDAHGLRRVLRVIRQRHHRQGLVVPSVAAPVVELLLSRGWPRDLEDDVEELLRDWLGALIVVNESAGHELRLKLRQRIVKSVEDGKRRLTELEAEREAERAARTPEQVREDERRERQHRSRFAFSVEGSRGRRVELPRELIEKSTLENLSLLGPDLGDEGETLLRRVARDAPHHLAPAVEEIFAGRAIASYRPALLTELVEAYYLDDRYNDLGFGSLYDGIRPHHSRSGLIGPHAASYRGPFLAMFQTDFRNGVACLNRLLNHAARVRAASLQELDPSEPLNEQAYRTVLSITGEPRTYIGDEHVWLWYRGTGAGPYPCMSALQALEVVCDQFIEADIPPGCLVPFLLEGCENLAMAALVVGLLVRHLDKAGDALDPFFTEPVVWQLEFRRVMEEFSGLAADSEGIHAPERRKWSLREVAMSLVLSAEGERIDALRELGEGLIARGRELEAGDSKDEADEGEGPSMSEELAAIHGWAAALDRNSYQITEHGDGLLIQPTVVDDVKQVLEPGNQDWSRGNQASGLLLRYVVPL